MNKNNFVVIMAGGIGSRFWPFSRTSFPKQFHDVLGTGKTMIQQTVERFETICPKENIFIVTNTAYKDLVKSQIPFLTDDQILCEPVGRNTAPCAAYACYKIYRKNTDATIIVAPSDHVILKEQEFERRINLALDITSKNDVLITLGIKPSRPDTGYGYIQFIEGATETKKVKIFTEKPPLELAEKFVESGEFLWNAGIFVWSANSVIKAFEKHLPDMAEIFAEGNHKYWSPDETAFIESAYSQCINISIDYGIMEKADNVYVLPSDFGWSDVGTWKSLYDVSQKSPEGNVVSGNTMLYNTKNCIIKTPFDKLVVIEGLEDYIVAEFDGVLMICNKNNEQKVKEFVADARAQKGERFV
ncbi:MAG TPA: mannose-1-phosphate guanylyltransferase, partial [Cytophagaceae bacterium]|nr:mannose-1-phosphate guanylyltransferase [Cytophagaceae bacterium]